MGPLGSGTLKWPEIASSSMMSCMGQPAIENMGHAPHISRSLYPYDTYMLALISSNFTVD